MTPFRLRARVRAAAETRLRRLWMKYALRGVSKGDAHDRLDLAYLVPDPWKLDSAQEHARFAATSEAVTAAFGPDLRSILELGSGEGVQSEYFARQCQRLTGVEVSARAVERARFRLPRADFVAGDLLAMPWVGERGRFDVVVAGEMLYYLAAVPRTLAAMNHLAARGCLVTYFAPAERKIGRFVRAMPGVQFSEARAGDQAWTIAWWRTDG